MLAHLKMALEEKKHGIEKSENEQGQRNHEEKLLTNGLEVLQRLF